MSTKSLADPFDMMAAAKALFAGPPNQPPGAQLLQQISETLRGITQAQLAYGQAISRANATLLAAILDPVIGRRFDPETESETPPANEPPTRAAHRRDTDAP